MEERPPPSLSWQSGEWEAARGTILVAAEAPTSALPGACRQPVNQLDSESMPVLFSPLHKTERLPRLF